MITYDYVAECLNYISAVGRFVWKVRPRNHFSSDRGCKGFNTRLAGNTAGHHRKDNYVHIIIDNKAYKAHRLAWLLFHGAWPDGQIDHIDGDSSNNRIDNLRTATCSQNMCNKGRYSNNTSGCKGVSFVPSTKKWRARLQKEHKRRLVGEFNTFEEAAAACNTARTILHGEYARAA